MFSEALRKRFWEKVDVRGADDCWLWKAAIQNEHGRFRVGEKMRPSQQVAWELFAGKFIAADVRVFHTCGSLLCCNPAHLFERKNELSLEDRFREIERQFKNLNGECKMDALEIVRAVLSSKYTLEEALRVQEIVQSAYCEDHV